MNLYFICKVTEKHQDSLTTFGGSIFSLKSIDTWQH